MPVPPSRLPLLLACPSLLVLALAIPSGAQEVAPSGLFSHEDLPVLSSGTVRIQQMLTGLTHSGFPIDLHATELAPGQMPHAPHRHPHEELLLIQEGTLEVTVGDRTDRLGPGSAAYVASGEVHGWRNIGETPARYFVLALGNDDPPPGAVPDRDAGDVTHLTLHPAGRRR